MSLLDDRIAIEEVIENYLDGLYRCDTILLSQVFHPNALYATAVGAEPLFLKMEEYFPIVEQRDPPARTNAARKERILDIDIAGPVTAFVKLECSFFQKDYIDFLTLIKTEQQWRIISKIFHYQSAI